MRVASLLFLGCLCVGDIAGDSRGDEPKPKRTDPATLEALHSTFAGQTDGALLKLVKENPGLVHDMDSSDCTALHYAARYGRVETARWLIGQKADVNTVSYNRFTPMHMVGDATLAELLIKGGADLAREDAWGSTPLQSAAEGNRIAVVDAILASGYKLDLRTAIVVKKREVVKKMLKDDPKLARQPSKVSGLWGDTTPLGLAARQKDKEIVELLLDAGADVNAGTFMPNAGGNATALTNAVWAGDKQIVKLLLDRGARTDVVGGKFYPTILDYARKHSDPEIVGLLEKAGAKGSTDGRAHDGNDADRQVEPNRPPPEAIRAPAGERSETRIDDERGAGERETPWHRFAILSFGALGCGVCAWYLTRRCVLACRSGWRRQS
jgi:ankyrin repeat protein